MNRYFTFYVIFNKMHLCKEDAGIILHFYIVKRMHYSTYIWKINSEYRTLPEIYDKIVKVTFPMDSL